MSILVRIIIKDCFWRQRGRIRGKSWRISIDRKRFSRKISCCMGSSLFKIKKLLKYKSNLKNCSFLVFLFFFKGLMNMK